MNNNQENKFSYTYSAKEQNEIKKIRDKYICVQLFPKYFGQISE